ncbi:Hypothetical protein LUCI_1075 [Lucifera butyrica]|uniref:D-isomer specific 2-hydroxyacid dehydrogenases signature 3 n=1 Tax=Lucifera butyrica TaxID=1351585 RepID=A0A498R327_9FIRM|nr:D-2-hydroxyacid dehydrogenase [Lucifera butyrica]VBB05864.1 Hypothetical protein LUCI_1075 [Lucifera butyrica]
MSPALNILVLNHLSARHIDAIQNVAPNANIICSTPEQAGESIQDTEILLAWGYMDIRPLVAAAPNLKWVHALTAGVEGLLFPELQQSDIIITNSKGIHGIPVSEHVLSLLLAFTRGINLFIRQQQNKTWERVRTDELYEKTIGIIGLGSIGREIAKKAKCLGMHVLATKRTLTNEIFVDKLLPPEQLPELLAAADVVVVALPLIEETRGLFTLEHFRAMKRSAYFINIARGPVVCQQDLITALQQELIRGAGLDVFEQEPLAADNPLWEMPNVIITPHVAALSPFYLDRAIKLFAEDLARYCQGREVSNRIDKMKGY